MNKLTALSLIVLLNPITMAAATESYYYRYGERLPAQAPVTSASSAPVAPNAPTISEERQSNTNMVIQQQSSAQPVVQRTVYAAPNAAHYGFYGQKSIQGSGPRFTVGGNPYTPSVRINQNSYYRSPVLTQEAQEAMRAKNLYYLGFRAGIGSTRGWSKGRHAPTKPLFGFVAGTWIKPNVRLDAEFDYHLKGKLANTATHQLSYKQYDLGANMYYDFSEIKYGLKPFVGGGLWLVKKRITDRTIATGKTESSSGWKCGFSASAGLTYPITDAFSLSAMLRGRYIVTNDSIYNLEALLGANYAF